MSVPASNTLIYALTGLKLFAEPDNLSEPIFFATDRKGEYRPWQLKDPVGFTTGSVISTAKGTWVELVTRVWKQRAFDRIRVDRTAWFRYEDQKIYTEDTSAIVDKQSLETRLLEAYDSLDKKYYATETYTNDAGKIMLVFANENRVTLDEYEKLSLIEKRNYAIPKTQAGIAVNDPTTPKSEEKSSLPAWAIGGLIALGVGFLGFLGYTLTKPSKNGKSKKR